MLQLFFGSILLSVDNTKDFIYTQMVYGGDVF